MENKQFSKVIYGSFKTKTNFLSKILESFSLANNRVY